jgi:hypothetical protein
MVLILGLATPNNLHRYLCIGDRKSVVSGVKEIEQNHRFGWTERDCLTSLFGRAELRVTNSPSSALDVIHCGSG